MRSARARFAAKVAGVPIRIRKGAAVAVVLAAATVLGLFGAVAAGAFASPVPAAPAGHPAASGHTGPAMRPTARTRTTAETTSCTTVGHIGDSTSVGMMSPEYLPDPAQRLSAQYAAVGVKHLRVDASGGRSIVEVMPDQVNGYNVARNWVAAGFRGCWVFALGTNDTANVAVGSNVSRMARVQEMMSVAHGEPVLWVNAHTLLSSGPWSEANMQTWNNTLVQACKQYPNMRIFNWAAIDQPNWHIADGIHYTSAGYAIRAAAIAHALAQAFPRGGHSTNCVVG